MSEVSFKFEKQNRTIMQRLFEPPAVGKMAPVAKVFAYTFLAIWSLLRRVAEVGCCSASCWGS